MDPFHILPGGDVIPTEGPDAATLLVYRSDNVAITRSTITTDLQSGQAQLVANLSLDDNQLDLIIGQARSGPRITRSPTSSPTGTVPGWTTWTTGSCPATR